MSLRYHLSISDAKINMLLRQADPGFGRKRTSEVGMSVKLLSGKRTVEAPRTDQVERLVGSPLFGALAG
ncbi:DUF7019 family protein [Actinomadura latina]|uniref:Uncharacterized protein n=1 Tax=Actinomadura latina TaxID=163603 RepID=A0A846Z0K4_9ACTN|nr:hypothetical protein [Actinomadura latina]NKZ05447.1 hypothetical protein [Actinomadura latina]